MRCRIRPGIETAMSTSGKGKKDNKNKIPQRGLGVAQLEKLRMEEQQRRAAAAAAAAAPLPEHRPVARNAVRPPSHSGSTPSTVFFGGPPPGQALADSPAVVPRSSGGGFQPILGSWSIPGPHHEDDAVRSPALNASSQNDPMSTAWRLSAETRQLQQQQQQFQQQILAAMATSAAKSPFSSGHNLQIEPPSNQNYAGSYNLHSYRREQNKMAGTKREFPFQQDTTSNQRKVHALTGSHRKFEESSPSHSTVFGGSNSSSSVLNASSEAEVGRKGRKDGVTGDGAFLTLGTTAQQNSKPVLIPAISSDDLSDQQSSALCQESLKSSSTSHDHRPFYNFLPPTDKEHEATSPEKKESKKDVDLKLKL